MATWINERVTWHPIAGGPTFTGFCLADDTHAAWILDDDGHYHTVLLQQLASYQPLELNRLEDIACSKRLSQADEQYLLTVLPELIKRAYPND